MKEKIENPTIQQGWNLRDEFASSVIQGIVSNADTMREITKAYGKSEKVKPFEECIATLSYIYADAMLKQRLL